MQVKQAGLDPSNPMIVRAVELATELIEFPRHLSQHVGGYVLTQDRLDTYGCRSATAAMDDRTFIEWDKDDVDTHEDDEGRCAGAGHADLHPEMFGSDRLVTKGRRYELKDIKAEGR